jgi:acetoin utilization deacetylase AcuC-like enzyme
MLATLLGGPLGESAGDGVSYGRWEAHDAAEAGDVERLRAVLAWDQTDDADEDFDPERAEEEDDDDAVLEGVLARRDNQGHTPLHVALLHGRADCVEACLEFSEEALPGANGVPVLHMVLALGALSSNAAVVERMARAVVQHIGRAAALQSRDDQGRTALHVCAQHGLSALAQSVLFESTGARRESPLRAMLAQERDPRRRAILEEQIREEEGEGGGSESVEGEAGFVDVTDAVGQSAAHVAARHGQTGFLHFLEQKGAKLGERDAYGSTPAHVAGKFGWRESASWLAKKGGVASDAAGRTAQELLAQFEGGAEAAGGGAGAAPASRTLVLTHPVCAEHLTSAAVDAAGRVDRSAALMPENPFRLRVLTHETHGVLRGDEFQRRAGIEWHHDAPRAALADILRVHEFAYVRALADACARAGGGAGQDALVHVDRDTTLSAATWEAAQRAAGAVVDAVRRVAGPVPTARNAFCLVRPPGHHAGPFGRVACRADADGSHGFCLLNNVAIGAAFARANLPHVRRIAIVDFDVHHGNGTEAILRNLVPTDISTTVRAPGLSAAIHTHSYKPWRDEDDGRDTLFVSTHGLGGAFYPGSGHTEGVPALASGVADLPSDHVGLTPAAAAAAAEAHAASEATATAAATATSTSAGTGTGTGTGAHSAESSAGRSGLSAGFGSVLRSSENPLFARVSEPVVVNVGLPAQHSWQQYRRFFVEQVVPKLVSFAPDLILVSAGFDAHIKDALNHGFGVLRDEDYEWLADVLVRVANTTAHGRLVAVLEGGYAGEGGIVSAFSRAVAGFLRVLAHPSRAHWKQADEERVLHAQLQAVAEFDAQQTRAAQERLAQAAAASAGSKRARARAGEAGDDDGDEDEEEDERPARRARRERDAPAAAAAAAAAARREENDDEEEEDAPVSRRPGRARTQVDYVALNEQLERQKKLAKKQ